MLSLVNPVQAYAWGAIDGLAHLVGTPPTGGPEAEMWVGAHPAAPSHVDDGRPLDEVIAADPAGVLGPSVSSRFGPRLPFLLKVLAIGGSLSIQLHPSADQAREGFAREDAAGIPRDAPDRTYRDPYAKPEVLVALAPTWVLAGFRSGPSAAAALARLDSRVVHPLIERVIAAVDARDALVYLLAVDGEARVALAAAAAAADDPSDPALAWVRRLAEAFPDDPTALAPLLLDLQLLRPGDGVFLPAGVPHAYLHGAGVELMSASDNVVRGGLTAKHVDRQELVRLLAPPGVGVEPLPGVDEGGGARAYLPPAPEIALRRVRVDGGPDFGPGEGPGPALVLATDGEVVVEGGGTEVALGRGRAVLVAAAERERCRLRGHGTLWWASAGSDDL